MTLPQGREFSFFIVPPACGCEPRNAELAESLFCDPDEVGGDIRGTLTLSECHGSSGLGIARLGANPASRVVQEGREAGLIPDRAICTCGDHVGAIGQTRNGADLATDDAIKVGTELLPCIRTVPSSAMMA